MKKIYTYILIAVAFLSFAPAGTIQAQKETKYDKGMGFSKNINGPDNNGVYTIELEAFTTGEIKVERKSIPADIVLVLDVSGSMSDRFGSGTKLEALKNAVNGFIDIINNNDLYDPDGNPRAQRLGNRIAIVTYSTTATNRTNGLVALGSSITDNGGVNSLKATVNGLNANGGTYAHRGMEMAYGILSPLDDTRQLRTTVFFTDGNPGYWGDWTSNNNIGNYNNLPWGNISRREDAFRTANATISAANNIKNLADAGKGIISNVYTISIINNPVNQTQVYLGKTSSNWLGADNMGWYTNNWGNLANCWNYNYNNGNVGSRNSSSTNFALSATSQDGLKDIFETIASDSGGSDADLDGASVAVLDIVSANFTLPPGTDKSNIKVYTAKCTGGTEGALTFDPRVEGYPSHSSTEKYRKMTRNEDGTITWSEEEYDIDDDIDVEIKGDNNKMIEVTGFDYSSNFCGFDNGTARGFKVIIDIPVKMDPDAVGGADSESNEAGSGIYADLDGDGSLDPIIVYEIPKIDLPTNIFIEKEGLKKGESAHFKIQRIPADTPESEDWEDVTTIFLTNTGGEENPIVKVRGLDPNYIYQIVEEPWSWSYTIEALTATRTDQLVTNPFKFRNTPKTDIDTKVKHAESKATNKFAESAVEYHDSKTNTRSTTSQR